MTWFRVDDTFASHPKVISIQRGAARLRAVGLWTALGTWCAGHLTDGSFPPHLVAELGGAGTDARRLIQVELWHDLGGGCGTDTCPDGVPGMYRFHDYLEYNPARTQVLRQRRSDSERQALSRNPELREAVRSRDGDRCRYCACDVRFHDRRGASGGTYDHVDPDAGTTLENLVVCCRRCNASKGRRPPEQAGMTLLPVPGTPVTKSDLDQNLGLKVGPVPTRPDPSPAAAAAVPLPPPLEILRSALEAHRLMVRWDRLNADDAAEIERLIELHGDQALVSSAQRQFQPNKPAAFVQAWLPGWRDLRQPGDLAVVQAKPCPIRGHSGSTRHCIQCASEQKAAAR